LPTNIGEGLVILAAIFAGVTLPLLPVQILWINMTTGVVLGLMLACEPKEPGIMRRPPRDPKTPILNRTLILRICLVALIMLIGAFGSFEWALGLSQRADRLGRLVAHSTAAYVIIGVEKWVRRKLGRAAAPSKAG
jgi:magnesium-transporting ATPase (P-type)